MKKITEVSFQKEFVQHFPGDESGSKQPRQTPGKLYSKALPTPVKSPALLAWSEALASELGLKKPNSEEEIAVLAGNKITPSMYPYAACYAGHQFGNWAGQLGDGRAITLGELNIADGQKRELQLKGPGPTAYSRRADGRAVLRSSVREYLMSEAMHFLAVPTTRALSLVTTGEDVLRDMFYDGHPAYEPGAIVLRVAPSFLRFGSFEMPAARGEIDNLQKLVAWTIEKFYPHHNGKNKILDWYEEVVDRTAKLIVEWHRVGFVHGVMNTDNMSILGLTIDYGPFSFIDNYDPNFTPNTTDLPGRRYAFGRQAAVAKWNLGCLGGALLPLVKNEEELLPFIDSYDKKYWDYFYAMMANKLGLDNISEKDAGLITDLEKMMATLQPDYTIFYQLLIDAPLEGAEEDVFNHFEPCFYQLPDKNGQTQFAKWWTDYKMRRASSTINAKTAVENMRRANPRFILRNYLLHEAITELEAGSTVLFDKLGNVLKTPYAKDHDEFFKKRPNWATQKAGCSMLSCSS